jgi:Proteasome activator pa28 beta subunit
VFSLRAPLTFLLRHAQSFQESSKVAALEIISKSPDTVKHLQETFQQYFPAQPVSAVTAAFSAESLLQQNDTCASAVAATLDAADHVLTAFAQIEQYVQLTVPKMEDGGNFGVGVQLAAIKVMADQAEKLDKAAEELAKYAASRADALEKCKLVGTTTTKSSTTTTSDTAGKDAEKGDIKSNSKSQSVEEKTVESVSTAVESALRKQAVVAVDVRFYSKAKMTFQAVITAFLAVADFLDKNQVKIEKPKGESGSRGYSGSMY